MAGRGFANDVWLKREGFYTVRQQRQRGIIYLIMTAWYYLLSHDSVVLFT